MFISFCICSVRKRVFEQERDCYILAVAAYLNSGWLHLRLWHVFFLLSQVLQERLSWLYCEGGHHYLEKNQVSADEKLGCDDEVSCSIKRCWDLSICSFLYFLVVFYFGA